MSTPRLVSENLKSPTFKFRTSSGRYVTLPPAGKASGQFFYRDLADHLSKVNYHPESNQALPFTAAQYAIHLAEVMSGCGPLAQIHAMLANAHEAYLGHRSWIARAVEMSMEPRIIDNDRRDRREQEIKARILEALEIPDLGNRQQPIDLLILHAREQLDVTLERDIGAHIDRDRERMAAPLPRRLTPLHCVKAMEDYVKLYRNLTILSGLPAKE